MIKKVTSVTIFKDAVGLRMSITYSVINAETGTIVEDNKRIDRIVTDNNVIEAAGVLDEYAQAYVDTQ